MIEITGIPEGAWAGVQVGRRMFTNWTAMALILLPLILIAGSVFWIYRHLNHTSSIV